MTDSVEYLILQKLERRLGGPEAAVREKELAERHGIRIIVPESADWPAELTYIPSSPKLLYVKGTLVSGERRLAIVGTRAATLGGKKLAGLFARDFALAGVTVVSGLARGIDTAAHQGALQGGGRTIAVLGTGLLNIYPSENVHLAMEIARNGAIISEFCLREPGLPQYFPARNRIISGLSAGVIVLEAPRKSGALITADHALEQTREVMAVPGSPLEMQSSGGNQLIQEGAACVTNAEDALAVMGWARHQEAAPERPRPALPLREQAVFETLSAEKPARLEELAAVSGIDALSLMTTLSEWELKGWVEQMPGNRYVKR